VALRLIPRDGELSSERAVLALRGAGLQHGRYGIFHRLADGVDEALFSVASLTEPGSFNLANLSETTIAGLSFFIVLPGEGDPVARFDTMIETARALAVELDADLHDERGSSWSIQRERYVREEIIEYRHQLERH
jgi:cell division protein ZipA